MGNQFIGIPVLYWYSVDSRDPCHGLDYICSIQSNTDSQNDPSFDHPSYATDGSMQSGIAPVGSASSEVDSYFNTWDSPGMEAIARLFGHGLAACPPHLSGVGHIDPSISASVAVGSSVSCLFMPSDNHAALNTSAVARQSSDITSQSSLVGRDTPNSPLHRSQRDTTGHGLMVDQDKALPTGISEFNIASMSLGQLFVGGTGTSRSDKSRSERPREPQWTEQDSELLKEAMPLFNSFNDEWQGIVEGSFELH
ncbi:hypothetical protein E4U09_004624 [Claviceps aff. purpurea]|uniref:Uncharacterized protein n=1 Tax=Claviceps aff. purpurea TaxID=1967640 RepID=A0A9P7U191_9HYPO|nr:hypothetical protein E4U09_004624 [Claviceps aff. purpurea]